MTTKTRTREVKIEDFNCEGFDPEQVKAVARWIGEFCEMTGPQLANTRAIRVAQACELLRRLEAAS